MTTRTASQHHILGVRKMVSHVVRRDMARCDSRED